MAVTDIYHIVGSTKPSRPATKFIATGDQACVVDGWAVAREAAAVSISVTDETGHAVVIKAA